MRNFIGDIPIINYELPLPEDITGETLSKCIHIIQNTHTHTYTERTCHTFTIMNWTPTSTQDMQTYIKRKTHKNKMSVYTGTD